MEQFTLSKKAFNLLREQISAFPLKESLGFFQALSNVDTEEEKIVLPKDLGEALFSYLASKPYSVVAQTLNSVFGELSKPEEKQNLELFENSQESAINKGVASQGI
jgi:hypothetical protein